MAGHRHNADEHSSNSKHTDIDIVAPGHHHQHKPVVVCPLTVGAFSVHVFRRPIGSKDRVHSLNPTTNQQHPQEQLW
jgi:hypothetical protein